jgi:hypothetical protein
MAWYNMDKEMREIAEITGKAEEVIAKNLDIKNISGEWTAQNRSEEGRVKLALIEAREEAKAKADKKAFEEKLAGGAAVWRKVSGEWLVQITGQGVKEGDIVKVERKNGSTSDELIRSIVTTNENGIFARV